MSDIERKNHKVDAEGKILGRLAVEISLLLRGKNKQEYSSHKDVGDFVEIKNTDKIKLTGAKGEQKRYYRHTGYLGGLKEDSYAKLSKEKPGEALRKAVAGMLPKNKLRPRMLKRMKIVGGENLSNN